MTVIRPFSPAQLLANVILKTSVPALWLVTGTRQSGKTSTCQGLADSARLDGYHVGGILCPPVFDGKRKVGFDLLAPATGERKRLGSRSLPACSGIQVGAWCLDPKVIAWGNAILRQQCDANILFIDELGVLELVKAGGFQEALHLLDSQSHNHAVVVIRSELLSAARERWPWANILPEGER